MGKVFNPPNCLAAVLIAILSATGAKAGGAEPFERIDAKALIKAYWDISEEQRASGVTTEMRIGGNRSLRCLEKIIVDQAQAMFDTKNLKRINVPEKIVMMRTGYGSLFWSIYNEHKECGSRCGTDRQLYHLSAYARLVEEMIEAMIRERNDMKF